MPNPNTSLADSAISNALAQVGKWYAWGAVGPDTFDCSGLLWYAYKKAGANVGARWTTYSMLASMQNIGVSSAQPGDFLFPHTGHVVMVINASQIVEAPHTGAQVRVQPRNGRTWVYARRFTTPGNGVTPGSGTPASNADFLSGVPGADQIAGILNFVKFATDSHNWLRLFTVIIGLALTGIGIAEVM